MKLKLTVIRPFGAQHHIIEVVPNGDSTVKDEAFLERTSDGTIHLKFQNSGTILTLMPDAAKALFNLIYPAGMPTTEIHNLLPYKPGMKGQKMSEEHKQKISEGLKKAYEQKLIDKKFKLGRAK